MQAVKWVVAKSQGDKTASFCTEMSGGEVTGRYISIPIFQKPFKNVSKSMIRQASRGLERSGGPVAGVKILKLDGPNRQSPVFSERSQLSQAILQFHVERMLHEWTPTARFESRHNERRVYDD